MKRIVSMCGIISLAVIFTGCSSLLKTETGRTESTYEVVDVRDVPEELQTKIEERKQEAFELTYRDMEYLYVVKHYGQKDKEGFCIEIVECTENENAIYIEAILHGPGGEGIVCETEYPFVVLRMAYSEKQVIFEN